MKKRIFVFKKNDKEVSNFKLCDLEFILKSYDSFEIIAQKTDFPQHLIVECYNDLDGEKDIWEVKET